jgi:hypothetical protein
VERQAGPDTSSTPNLFPSFRAETDIDFQNLEWFAVFREWTPYQLYHMTHGPKVDPGWNMPVVMNQLRYIGEQTRKQPNSVAYQYMPERIEELIKQDGGYWEAMRCRLWMCGIAISGNQMTAKAGIGAYSLTGNWARTRLPVTENECPEGTRRLMDSSTRPASVATAITCRKSCTATLQIARQ